VLYAPNPPNFEIIIGQDEIPSLCVVTGVKLLVLAIFSKQRFIFGGMSFYRLFLDS
jgi:hypothetical protein